MHANGTIALPDVKRLKQIHQSSKNIRHVFTLIFTRRDFYGHFFLRCNISYKFKHVFCLQYFVNFRWYRPSFPRCSTYFRYLFAIVSLQFLFFLIFPVCSYFRSMLFAEFVSEPSTVASSFLLIFANNVLYSLQDKIIRYYIKTLLFLSKFSYAIIFIYFLKDI